MAMDLVDWLTERLVLPLPGWKAQARFQPELSFGRHFVPPPPAARRAAVLVLLQFHADGWTVPLTLRPAEMLDHASQVSLPGGLIEPNERSEDAARRELLEELGRIPADLVLLGQLSPIYLFNSNFAVEPWLAATRSRTPWAPNVAEVAELIEAPLEVLCHPDNRVEWQREFNGVIARVPGIACARHRIWGATCMILAELIALVEEHRMQRL